MSQPTVDLRDPRAHEPKPVNPLAILALIVGSWVVFCVFVALLLGITNLLGIWICFLLLTAFLGYVVSFGVNP